MKYLIPIAPLYYLVSEPINGLTFLIFILLLLLIGRIALNIADIIVNYNKIQRHTTPEQLEYLIRGE